MLVTPLQILAAAVVVEVVSRVVRTQVVTAAQVLLLLAILVHNKHTVEQ